MSAQARRLLLNQLDRILNPRVHFGEPQPRRTPIPGVLTSTSKAVSIEAVTVQYTAFVLHRQAGVGYAKGTSTGLTLDFATSSVNESTSVPTASWTSYNMTAGSISVACGAPVDSAGGFVTIGTIPAKYADITGLALLDPGDLINVPGAVTIPLWDYLNNPRTGVFRKLTPEADDFVAIGSSVPDYCAMFPFILFNIPTGLLAAQTMSVQAFKSYDFYPLIADGGVPGVENQASETECVAAGYAQQICGQVLSGSFPFLAGSASRGSAAALVYSLEQGIVEQFVNLLGHSMVGLGTAASRSVMTNTNVRNGGWGGMV